MLQQSLLLELLNLLSPVIVFYDSYSAQHITVGVFRRSATECFCCYSSFTTSIFFPLSINTRHPIEHNVWNSIVVAFLESKAMMLDGSGESHKSRNFNPFLF